MTCVWKPKWNIKFCDVIRRDKFGSGIQASKRAGTHVIRFGHYIQNLL